MDDNNVNEIHKRGSVNEDSRNREETLAPTTGFSLPKHPPFAESHRDHNPQQLRFNRREAIGAASSPTEGTRSKLSGYAGGLNGSTQHSSRTRRALKTKAKSLARVRSAGTLPWLGFDRGQPNRPLLLGKALSAQHLRWCCIDRLSWHDLRGTMDCMRKLPGQRVCSDFSVAQRSHNLVRPEFATRCMHHFFSLPGQLTTNEKLCSFFASGDVLVRNRPSGATS